MNTTEIQPKEKKEKRLFVPVSQSEHNNIMQFCKSRKVTLADLVRFALKQTFNL